MANDETIADIEYPKNLIISNNTLSIVCKHETDVIIGNIDLDFIHSKGYELTQVESDDLDAWVYISEFVDDSYNAHGRCQFEYVAFNLSYDVYTDETKIFSYNNVPIYAFSLGNEYEPLTTYSFFMKVNTNYYLCSFDFYENLDFSLEELPEEIVEYINAFELYVNGAKAELAEYDNVIIHDV